MDPLEIGKLISFCLGYLIVVYGCKTAKYIYKDIIQSPKQATDSEPITQSPRQATDSENLDNVFGSFLQHEIFSWINTTGITILLAAFFLLTILYFIKLHINKQIFRTSVEEIKDISTIFGMFYTSTIELAGRKGSRIFGLFLTIFFYLAILNLIGLLFVAVTAKSQLSTTFWFSLTIIISFLLLGIRNKGLKFFLMFWNTGVGLFTVNRLCKFYSRKIQCR